MPSPAPRTAMGVPLLLAGVVVLLQTSYPLVHGHLRSLLTISTVVVFFLATVVHAGCTRGVRWTGLYLLVTAGTGLVAEATGIRTGVPFGRYHYSHALGVELLGVPVVIPLAWAMFAYPCLLVGQRLCRSPAAAALTGAVALASWDLFLDPQMVAAGHWHWVAVHHELPGINGIPVSNFAGWLAVATVMVAALQLLPRRAADDRVPQALFGWTYGSSVLANAVFFGRPGVALVGGVAMGVVALPLLVACLPSRPTRAAATVDSAALGSR